MALRLAARATGLLTLMGAGILISSTAHGGDPAPGEAWRTSPHHGVTNEATGKPIPCVCRFKERDFRLGEGVCMQTHVGVVIAKCDLQLNNTTWVPTDQACALSFMTPVPRAKTPAKIQSAALPISDTR